MKLFMLISIFIVCNFALAESEADLVKKGCIPRRNATTGEISGFDCDVARNANRSVKIQMHGTPKKVEMKNISSDMQTK